MSLELYQHIKEMDDSASSEIQSKHGPVLAIIEEALNEVLVGLNEYSSVKGKPDNYLESARIHLAVRSFNSLNNALQVLERGYYQQALTLLRMALEDQLIANDIELFPATLTALMEDEGKIGKGKLTYHNMAGRISIKAQEAWDMHYGFLSAHAAHPRAMSLRGLSVANQEGDLVLGAGSCYDEIWVNAVLCYQLRALVQVMETVAKLMAEAGGKWQINAIPVFEKVMSHWQELEAWAQGEMGKSDLNNSQAQN